ncbi:MAG TPA: hypothetical protein VIK78_09850 [Ruminiclostridium sp.]
MDFKNSNAKIVTGKDLLVARLLSWYPKVAIGSAILESLVAHRDKDIYEFLLGKIDINFGYTTSSFL